MGMGRTTKTASMTFRGWLVRSLGGATDLPLRALPAEPPDRTGDGPERPTPGARHARRR
ncbi:hypothetical protein ABIC27_001529 [Streptomyces sp. PvR034]